MLLGYLLVVPNVALILLGDVGYTNATTVQNTTLKNPYQKAK